MIVIDRNDAMPYYRQIHRQVVNGIAAGVYREGDRLPSIRAFALELGVSRNTVEQAYATLAQEGYIRARQGSGFFIGSPHMPRSPKPTGTGDYSASMTRLAGYDTPRPTFGCDFGDDHVDPELFPFYRWARISREVTLDPGREGICWSGDMRGSEALRKQVANHLARELDIFAEPSQIAVMPSAGCALLTATSLLAETCHALVLDNPGCPELAAAARTTHLPIKLRTTFPTADWSFIDAAPGEDANRLIVCLDPSCQYPLNHPLTLEERGRLVSWAQADGSYLVEDVRLRDFWHDGIRPPTLWELDSHGRVIVLGSFEHTLAPASRIAFLVLPPQLMVNWLEQRNPMHPLVPWQTQETLAEFMRQDLWYSHVRRMHTAIRRRHEIIRSAIDSHMAPNVVVPPQNAARHLLVEVSGPYSDEKLALLAADAGVRVLPTRRLWQSKPPSSWRFVQLGFAGTAAERIYPGIAALADAWFPEG